jgi:hypothetical protein
MQHNGLSCSRLREVAVIARARPAIGAAGTTVGLAIHDGRYPVNRDLAIGAFQPGIGGVLHELFLHDLALRLSVVYIVMRAC